MKILGSCLIAALLTGCASTFDKPRIVIGQTPDGQDRIIAWSSGSAAAVGMTAGEGLAPGFCVLGAAFARTGTADAGLSIVLPAGKSADLSSSATAGALLIKNEGQAATYLDTGLFHLCMLYAQGLIGSQDDRVALLKQVMISSEIVAKSSVQFATTASLQPSGASDKTDDSAEPKKPAPAAATPSGPAAKAPTTPASGSSGSTNYSAPFDLNLPLADPRRKAQRDISPTQAKQNAADVRRQQDAARKAQSTPIAAPR